MFHILLSTLKVLFRNGETIIDILQQIITEVKGKTTAQNDLDELKARNIPDGVDKETGEVLS